MLNNLPILNLPLHQRLKNLLQLDVCNACTQCSLRCAGGTLASLAEWQAIRAYVQSLPPEKKATFQSIWEQPKQETLGDGIQVTMCRFLDKRNRLCAIYPVRPLVCRLMGHVAWMPCPIQKVATPLSPDRALEILEQYSSEERCSFEEWQKQLPIQL